MGDDGRMAVDVTTEIVIARPCEQVAAYAGDPTYAPGWCANISPVHWQTPPPMGVGSRLDFVDRFLGRTLAYTYEVIEYGPHRLVMRIAQGPFPMETTYTWQPEGESSTRMTLRNRGELVAVDKLAGPEATNGGTQ
jgi:hypothetical protein